MIFLKDLKIDQVMIYQIKLVIEITETPQIVKIALKIQVQQLQLVGER